MSRLDVVTAKNVDLSNCDREQIQYSGAVQPHGALLVLDAGRERVLQASLNTEEWFSRSHDETIGVRIDDLLGHEACERFRHKAATERMDARVAHLGSAKLGRRDYHLLAHAVDGVEIWELEEVNGDLPVALPELYTDLHGRIGELNATSTVSDFFNLAVEQIQRFTGYERVMAYKFADDGSGHVMAEAVADGLERYLGLHYPASDIPLPARRLFSLTWLRHLPSVNYKPIPIAPENNPITGGPLDLSRSFLRSVSVMYTEYLKNMGVQSTMVITLLKQGKLWGLISCMQHSAPKHVRYEVRIACEFLAHMVSLLLAAKEDLEIRGYLDSQRSLAMRLVEEMARHGDYREGLARASSPRLTDCFRSSGAAIVAGTEVRTFGKAPQRDQVKAIAEWLNGAETLEPIYATNRLGLIEPKLAEAATEASGLLALRLIPDGHYLLFFRPELTETVNWAGDPEKPVTVSEVDGQTRLAPRGSFALWKQEARFQAEPWLDGELEVANDLRRAVVDVILRNAHTLAGVNRQLEASNAELASFAFAASHDLKEPLRGIHNYTQLLERSLRSRLTEAEANRIRSILRLTNRMEELLESLLEYSRVGQMELAFTEVAVGEVISEVLQVVEPRRRDANVDIRVKQPLPSVQADRVRLTEILQNLVVNALKYNDKSEKWVEVGYAGGRPGRFYVKDNGIGIAEKHMESIFRIFKRLHGQDEYGGGSGAGLTITKRLIERHGGRIWVESVPGEGTTFWFTLSDTRAGGK